MIISGRGRIRRLERRAVSLKTVFPHLSALTSVQWLWDYFSQEFEFAGVNEWSSECLLKMIHRCNNYFKLNIWIRYLNTVTKYHQSVPDITNHGKSMENPSYEVHNKPERSIVSDAWWRIHQESQVTSTWNKANGWSLDIFNSMTQNKKFRWVKNEVIVAAPPFSLLKQDSWTLCNAYTETLALLDAENSFTQHFQLASSKRF